MRPIRPVWEDYLLPLEPDVDELTGLKVDSECLQNYVFDLEEYVNYLEQTLERYEETLYP